MESVARWLPDEFRDRHCRRKIRCFQELAERRRIEGSVFRGAMQLLAVDAGGHEQTIKTLVMRALDIGVHGIANDEDARTIDEGIAMSSRQLQSSRIDRGTRLAGLD